VPASTVIIVAGAWLILAGLTIYWLWRTRHEPREEPPVAAEMPEPEAAPARGPEPPAGSAGRERAGEAGPGGREGGGGQAPSDERRDSDGGRRDSEGEPT